MAVGSTSNPASASAARTRSRSTIVASTSPSRRVAERGRRDRGRRPGDRRRRAPLGEQRGGVGMRERVADAQGREAERLRHRAQDDEVGELVDPRRARARAVLDVRLVGDDDRLRRRARRAPRSPPARPSSRWGCRGCRPSGGRRPRRRRRRPPRAAWSRSGTARTSARRSRRARPGRGTPARAGG